MILFNKVGLVNVNNLPQHFVARRSESERQGLILAPPIIICVSLERYLAFLGLSFFIGKHGIMMMVVLTLHKIVERIKLNNICI